MEPITPSILIDTYNNSLTVPMEHGKLCIKGIFEKGGDTLYAGQYYDVLKEESGLIKVTLKTTSIQRNRLEGGKLATIIGSLNRKIRNDGTIAISINVSEVVKVEESKISEEEIKKIRIQNKKLALGFANPELIIKERLHKLTKPKIALVYALHTIVAPEFENALSYAQKYIQIKRKEIAFTNSREVIELVNELANEYEIIAFIRGGGTGKDLFDSVEFCEKLIEVKSCLVSAIGHKAESFFFKNIADKVCDTPTALGNFLKSTIDDVMAEMNKSKAILTDQVKVQFTNQISTLEGHNSQLNKRLDDVMKTNTKLVSDINESNKKVNSLENQLREVVNKPQPPEEKIPTFIYWIILVLLLVIAFLYLSK